LASAAAIDWIYPSLETIVVVGISNGATMALSIDIANGDVVICPHIDQPIALIMENVKIETIAE
jgi:hypothetical protein